MPGGAIVDAARSERLVAGLAVAAIGVSALAYALWPIFPVVIARPRPCMPRQAACSAPAIAAISLGLVGPRAIGERLGRNARFASLGNGSAAALMGACGYFLSSRSVFFVTAVLLIPTLLALARIRAREIDPEQAHGAVPREVPDPEATSVLHLAAPAPAADLRRLRAAVPARQCRDAAADGRRGDHALEPMGDGADRGLHHRAAGHRRADLALGRAQGAGLGAAAAPAAGLCRAGDPRRCCSRS